MLWFLQLPSGPRKAVTPIPSVHGVLVNARSGSEDVAFLSDVQGGELFRLFQVVLDLVYLAAAIQGYCCGRPSLSNEDRRETTRRTKYSAFTQERSYQRGREGDPLISTGDRLTPTLHYDHLQQLCVPSGLLLNRTFGGHISRGAGSVHQDCS